MSFRTSYIFLAVAIISTGTAFAQESIITVETDDKNYDERDTIVISGKVTTVIGSTPVTLQLFKEGSLVDVAQITVATDGSYSHTMIAEGPLWEKQGEYIIRASYGVGNTAQTDFQFSPESAILENKGIFEVDAGNHGTFDVKYTITGGGTIKDIVINPDMFALEIKIETEEDGKVTLDLPREYIGAEKQNGRDDIFIILVNEIEVPYTESVVHEDSRIITISFEQDDSDIIIIGTYAIPEFGSIVFVVITIAMLTAVLVSNSKFQTKTVRF